MEYQFILNLQDFQILLSSINLLKKIHNYYDTLYDLQYHDRFHKESLFIFLKIFNLHKLINLNKLLKQKMLIRY